MIRQCAWCCAMGGQIAPFDDPSVTHGLCDECRLKLLEPIDSRNGAAALVPHESADSPMPGGNIE